MAALIRTGATLVAMAAVEAETLGWQKQGCALEGTSSPSTQVPPHWQGRGPSEPTPSAKPSYKAPPPSWAPRQPNQPPLQPKHPPRHTREEQAGGPRQPKPTPTSSRPTSFAQSCYEEDERWASGGYPSTPAKSLWSKEGGCYQPSGCW